MILTCCNNNHESAKKMMFNDMTANNHHDGGDFSLANTSLPKHRRKKSRLRSLSRSLTAKIVGLTLSLAGSVQAQSISLKPARDLEDSPVSNKVLKTEGPDPKFSDLSFSLRDLIEDSPCSSRLERQHLERKSSIDILDRLLSPDAFMLSMSRIQVNFKTPGKAINYVKEFFPEENAIAPYFGDYAILPPNLDFIYFVNPKSKRPFAIVLNYAWANVTQHGDVKFLGVPFDYSLSERASRFGVGGELPLFPKNFPSNIWVGALGDLYHGEISVKGTSPIWIERLHDDGFGYGYRFRLRFEQRLDTKGFDFLPKDLSLVGGISFTRAVIADYGKIKRPEVFLGFEVNLSR